MQDASSFFGTAGGLLARPPKRVVPANRGANNAYINAVNGSNFVPCRVAAGTFMALPRRGITGDVFSLYSATNGSLIASTPAATDGYCWDSLVYDYTAGFFYVLGFIGTTLQLYKINDTTGARTAVGSAFTPATVANWTFAVGGGHAYISGANMKFVSIPNHVPYVHTINLSTGAIVSQDQALTLSDGTVVKQFFQSANVHFYITADESAAVSLQSYPADYPLRTISFVKGGVNAAHSSNNAMLFPNDGTGSAMRMIWNGECLVAVADGNNNIGRGWRYVDRADYDRYLKALIKATAGV